MLPQGTRDDFDAFKLKVLSDSHYVLSGQFLSYVSQCIDSYMKENWRIYKNSGIQG